MTSSTVFGLYSYSLPCFIAVNRFQAGRVGCQGLTLLAMAYYGWFGPMKKRKTLRQRIP